MGKAYHAEIKNRMPRLWTTNVLRASILTW
jgi:hypothetical protein